MAVSVGIYTGIAASVLVILVQLKYQKIVGSNATALIFSGEPVFASIFSYYFLNERLSELQFAGAVLLIIAVILASLKRSDEI
jgi:drug/metabolite transporter (DMT)-like permease